jgi:pimeloyl-ACP methyl ester carboxylesterase
MAIIEIDGVCLEHRFIPGEAGRTPLVLLHEGLGSVELWRDFPEKLARRVGAPTLVYSRRGYGRSDPLAGPRTTRFMHEEALETLPRLLDRLAITRPLLVGHSDGASIALIHAALAGRPVAGLVAMAPHVFVEDVSVESIARIRERYRRGDLRARLAKYHAHVDDAFLGWADAWLLPEFRAWSLVDLCPRITVPVLLVQGTADEYGSMAQLDAIEQGVAGPVTRLELKGAGHSPHREREAEVSEAIVEHARRCAAFPGSAE